MNVMNGYLSYTLAALAIIGAGAGYFLGIIEGEAALGIVWTGLALFGIRRAVSY